MLDRTSSKEMLRVLVAFELVKAERSKRVFILTACWRIGAGFVGDVEGKGNV
jgi:hypothetical protein